MKASIVSLLTLATAVVLPAQTSPEYLVHHDFLPSGSGTYVNAGSTGAVNDGTPLGNVTITAGPIGAAVSLGGVMGDEVNCGPTPILGNQERTVSVWARTTAASGLVTPLAFGTNPGNGTKWDMDIDCTNGGTLELGVSGGRTTGVGPAVNDGQWHMLTMVLPTGGTTINQVRMFVDGLFIYSNSGTQVVNTQNGPVVVGRSANPLTLIQFFPGDVDEPVLWSTALNDAQVKGLYDVGVDTNLFYGPNEYERLLEVYRQNQVSATIGALTWQRVTGLTGAAGLTPIGGGNYQLLFDTTTGAGLVTGSPVLAAFSTSGAGCPSPVGLSTLSAPQLPVLGATLEVAMANVSPTGLPLMVIGFNTTLPFPIALIGLTNDPTCLATVNLDALVGPLGVVGTSASLLLPIPNNPGLAGAPLYFQGAQLELTNGFLNLSDQGNATLGF